MAAATDWREGVLLATRDLTPDIRLFEIETKGAFVAPASGGHIDVAVQIGERADVRSYSIVNGAGGVYRIAVKRLPQSRGGSAYMWSLAPGARIRHSAPANHFDLGVDAPEYLLLAGGIGVTPIYAHALALADRGASFRMVYGVRGAADAALADELRERIGDRLTLLRGDSGGRIDFDAEFARLAPGGEAYVCGPLGMLEDAKRAWAASRRPMHRLRFETFGASGRLPTAAFVANIPRLGKSIAVPAGRSLLEALEAAGVAMISDCRRGECGLCALPVLGFEGELDHRDVFFSEAEKAEGRKLCTCVSRVYGASITLDTADR